MGKKLTPVDQFYIDHHKDKFNAAMLAKQIGCTERTIYNYLAKIKERARANEVEKEEDKPKTTEEAYQKAKEEEARKAALPPKGAHSLNLLGILKRGTGGAVTMTPEASMMGDEIMKTGGSKTPPHVHVMNPDR